MFTGIIEKTGKLIKKSIRNSILEMSFKVTGSNWNDLTIGESISVSGVCLTVIDFDVSSFSANVSMATAQVTNLNQLQINESVNLERSMKTSSRLGGHFVQGHADGTGKVVSTLKTNGALTLKIEPQPALISYLVVRGSVAVNGTSLTIQELSKKDFSVTIIPFTAEHTNIKFLKIGSIVNIEIDILAKYIRKFLTANSC
jgi:riboflavin synthase